MRSVHHIVGVMIGLFLGLVAPGRLLATDLAVEVVVLRYRTVEQMLPVIQPLIPSPGTATGLQGKLVIRTTPANLAEIKRALAALDRAPRRLLITVRQDAESDGVGSSVSSSPSRTAGGSHVSAARPSDRLEGGIAEDAARARVYGTQSASNERQTQQVQVLEGNEASISIGYSVPVTLRRPVRGVVDGRVIDQWADTVEYRDILSGFTVRPRLAGNNIVTLDVSPQHDTPAPYGRGSMNVQRVSTTVSGRLGDWIDLGAVVRGRAFGSDSATYRTSTASQINRRIVVKVEEID